MANSYLMIPRRRRATELDKISLLTAVVAAAEIVARSGAGAVRVQTGHVPRFEGYFHQTDSN